MIPRLLIVTEIIAPYRIPVFNALAQRGEIDLHVLFLSETDPGLRRWRVYKDEIHFSYEVLPSWRKRFGDFSLLLNRGVRTALERRNPDIVLCGGYSDGASWQAAYWCKARSIPFLLWSESTALDRRRSFRTVEWIKKRFLSLCRAFVVPGKSSFEYLGKLGAPEGSIFTAPNAIDVRFFSSRAEQARSNPAEVRARHALPPRYFLFVGRLIEAKGVFDLIAAYAQLDVETRSEVGLIFAGAGAAHQGLKQKSSAIEGHIGFLDFVHREDLPAVYALADALMFPTHSDPWGLVVNEAMACGLPVVGTKVAGCARDLIASGGNGLVVAPHDVRALTQAMQTLAADSTLRRQMGECSQRRIQAFSPEAWAQGVVEAVHCARNATG